MLKGLITYCRYQYLTVSLCNVPNADVLALIAESIDSRFDKQLTCRIKYEAKFKCVSLYIAYLAKSQKCTPHQDKQADFHSGMSATVLELDV